MKLSIITVNLNNANGLRLTIESILCQTFTDFEHIIIDGGSIDGKGTAAVWRGKGRKGFRIWLEGGRSSMERELVGIWMATVLRWGKRIVTNSMSSLELLKGKGKGGGQLDRKRGNPVLMQRVR